MMTYMLEHQYTNSLSFQLLKNGDKRVADVLVRAKTEVYFDLYVSTVHVTESWSVFSYDWGQKHIATSLEEEEVNTKSLIAHDGTILSSVIILDKEYFVPQDFFSNITPSKETYYDAVGVDSDAQTLAPPSNQTRAATFLCTCHDCLELKKFMQHPSENYRRFKIGMKRREHLQQQLDDTWADATYVTEHTGSPHTLVITKTQDSYKEKCQKRQQEQTLLSALQPLFMITIAEYRPPTKKQRAEYASSTGCSTSEVDHIDLT